MRFAVLVLGFVITAPALAEAQEWDLFVSKEDGFKVDFPGTPKVTEAQWKTEQGYALPSRIYSVERGPLWTTTVSSRWASHAIRHARLARRHARAR
jgi:hypothetical protein